MIEPLAVDRRMLLTRAMLLAGAVAVAGCDFLPGAGAAAKLDGGQIKLLGAVADAIVPKTDTPGALEVGVPRLLAQIYADWASDESRAALSGALVRIDAAARKQTGRGFAALDPAARQVFLSGYDKAALAPAPPPPGAAQGAPSVADNGYYKLKELVVTLYYMSEAGLTTELTYEHVPGQWQPSIKATPETRPAMAFGAF